VSEGTPRERFGALIQAEVSDEEEMEAVLVGWVMVAEWVGPNSEAWMTRLDGNAAGDALPTWRRDGLLDYAKGDWNEE
jgi:hypothetical protein